MNKRLNKIGAYSIKDLERLSGIKAHTIRIWEKRYQLVSPQRTTTNIRYYSDDDLKKILNVAMLNQAGLKISNLASLKHKELCDKIEEYSVVREDHKYFVDQLVFAMIDMDDEKLEKIIDNAIVKFGFEAAMTEIVYPFFRNVGLMWLTGKVHPGQEHCISNVVRRKLILAIDRRNKTTNSKKKVVFFLPVKEWHELGLLFYHYIALGEGVNTYYLGQSVPVSTVHNVIDLKDITHLVFSHLSVKDEGVLHTYISDLVKVTNSQKIIFIDRKEKKNMALNKRVFNPNNISEFKEILRYNV